MTFTGRGLQPLGGKMKRIKQDLNNGLQQGIENRKLQCIPGLLIVLTHTTGKNIITQSRVED